MCLPGARIEHVTERVEKIVGRENGGTIVTILVHVGTNNTDKEGTTAIVEKYRKLLKKTKQARLGQIILSGVLPVCGNRIQGYRNSKRMAVNGMVEWLCKEEDVGYVDMWDSFVGNEELYFRDGLHLSGKGAAVLAEGLSGAVASGLGKVRYLKVNLKLVRLSLINIHILYVECKHVFHFCISRAILYIIFPMSLYYQNTRTPSGNFPIFMA